MAKKNRKEKLYTDQMLSSIFGLKAGTIRETFPAPDRIVFDSRGYGHPAWYKTIVDQMQDDLRNRSGKGKPSRMQEIMEYLRQYDYSEMAVYARSMEQRFILHIGPTNSGKTYDVLQDLKNAEKGVYLCPLRLLALEVFDRLNMDETRLAYAI